MCPYERMRASREQRRCESEENVVRKAFRKGARNSARALLDYGRYGSRTAHQRDCSKTGVGPPTPSYPLSPGPQAMLARGVRASAGQPASRARACVRGEAVVCVQGMVGMRRARGR